VSQVIADCVEKQPIGLGRIWMSRIEPRHDQYGYCAWRIARLVRREVRIECRNDVDASDLYAWCSTNDRVEVFGRDESVAVLQIARNLLLTFSDGLRIGPTPRPQRIGDAEAGR